MASAKGGAKFGGSDPEFSWSDGHLEITKRFHFDNSYVVHVETITKLDGAPKVAGIAWLGGFGDLTVQNPTPIDSTSVFYDQGGKLTNIAAKKLDGPEKWGPGVWQGDKDWTGIEDRYFTAVFLPGPGPAPGTLEARYWRDSRNVLVDVVEIRRKVAPQIATRAAADGTARLRVGPRTTEVIAASPVLISEFIATALPVAGVNMRQSPSCQDEDTAGANKIQEAKEVLMKRKRHSAK